MVGSADVEEKKSEEPLSEMHTLGDGADAVSTFSFGSGDGATVDEPYSQYEDSNGYDEFSGGDWHS